MRSEARVDVIERIFGSTYHSRFFFGGRHGASRLKPWVIAPCLGVVHGWDRDQFRHVWDREAFVRIIWETRPRSSQAPMKLLGMQRVVPRSARYMS